MFLVRYCSNSAVDEEHRRYCQLLNHGSPSSSSSEESGKSLTGDFRQQVQIPHSKIQRRRLLERIAMKHAPQLLKKIGRSRQHIVTEEYRPDQHPPLVAATPPNGRQHLQSIRVSEPVTDEDILQQAILRGLPQFHPQSALLPQHNEHPVEEIRLQDGQASPSMSSPSCSVVQYNIDEQYLDDVFPPFLPGSVQSDRSDRDHIDDVNNVGHSDKTRVTPACDGPVQTAVEHRRSPAFSDPPTFLQLSDPTTSTWSSPPSNKKSPTGDLPMLHSTSQRSLLQSRATASSGNAHLVSKVSTSHTSAAVVASAATGRLEPPCCQEVFLTDSADSPSTITMHGLDRPMSEAPGENNNSNNNNSNLNTTAAPVTFPYLPRRQLWKENSGDRCCASHDNGDDGAKRRDAKLARQRTSQPVYDPFVSLSDTPDSNTPSKHETTSFTKENRDTGNRNVWNVTRKYVDPFDKPPESIDWDYSFLPLSNKQSTYQL